MDESDSIRKIEYDTKAKKAIIKETLQFNQCDEDSLDINKYE